MTAFRPWADHDQSKDLPTGWPPRVYWLTRDAHDYAEELTVDVWTSRPKIVAGVWCPGTNWGDTYQLAAAVETEHAAALPLDVAKRVFGTIPETPLECVRVELG